MGKKSKFLDKDIHRYFALMFVIFVLSQELLIDGDGNLIDFRFFCAVVIVVATPFLLGNRNAMLSCCINVGFFVEYVFFWKKRFDFSFFKSMERKFFFTTLCIDIFLLVDINSLPNNFFSFQSCFSPKRQDKSGFFVS